MEDLLCDEVMSPIQEYDIDDGFNSKKNSFILPMEDCEEALSIFVGNESSYMPESGYLKLVETDELIPTARFKAVIFIIKTQRRMDLSVEVVFTAVNYLDRFISLDKCQGWKCWMFELLSIACLTVASKFNGTTTNFVNEFQTYIQMNNDLENSFGASAIQQMELTLMTALGWRMNSTTPFSYIQYLTTHDQDLTQRVTQLLLNALLEPKFVIFKQSVIAMSAIRCAGNNDSLLHTIIPQEQKDNVIKCLAMMKQVSESSCESCWGGGPSSPVTVLKDQELFSFCDSAVEDTKSSRKRKMKDRDECIQF